MEEILEKLEELIEQNEEGKVTFTFRQRDPEVNLIVNRHKFVKTIEELYDYKRDLEKYEDPKNEIIIDEKENRIVSEEELNSRYDPAKIENRHSYVKKESVINKIEDVLDIAYSVIYEYLYK